MTAAGPAGAEQPDTVAPPFRILGLGYPEGCWYNRSIHEFALVDHAGAVRPATGFFAHHTIPQFSLIAKKAGARFTTKTFLQAGPQKIPEDQW